MKSGKYINRFTLERDYRDRLFSLIKTRNNDIFQVSVAQDFETHDEKQVSSVQAPD